MWVFFSNESNMETILKELGLQEIQRHFSANDIGFEDIAALKDSEWEALGVQSLGVRCKIRRRCELHKMQATGSTVAAKVADLQSRRRGNTSLRTNNSKHKDTRKIYVGWKHLVHGTFVKVPESKGGGSRSINAVKSATLSDLKVQICNVYFTDGDAPLYDLKLAELDVFLANFSGIQIEDTLITSDGDKVPFTFAVYLESLKSSPVRIYLHTSGVSDEIVSGQGNEDNKLPECVEGASASNNSRRKRSKRLLFKKSCTKTSDSAIVIDDAEEADNEIVPDLPSLGEIMDADFEVTFKSTDSAFPSLNLAVSDPISGSDVSERNTEMSMETCNGRDNSIGLSVSEIREAQDLEYFQSLKADQEKEKKKQEEKDRIKLEDELKEKTTELCALRKSRLPPEPEDGFFLKIRTADQIYSRRFTEDQDAQVLMNFVGSLPSATAKFTLSLPGSKKCLNNTATGALKGHDISCSLVLSVTWTDDCEVAQVNDHLLVESVQQVADSLQPPATNATGEASNLKQLIRFHTETQIFPHTADGPFFNVNVLRADTLEDAIYKVQITRPEEFKKKLRVQFRYEAGIDDGGPSREFASLIVQQLADSKYVRGPDTGKSFARHHNSLQDGDFKAIGCLTAITLLNGGFGVPIFTRPVAEFIVYGKPRNQCKIEDVPDSELKHNLLKIQNMTTKQLREDIDNIFPDRQRLGFSKMTNLVDEQDIPNIQEALAYSETMALAMSETEQFIEGLKTLDVLHVIRANPDSSLELFLANNTLMTAAYLEKQFHIEFSPVNSNRRRTEEKIANTWAMFLETAEAEKTQINDEGEMITTNDIFQWVTGAARMPVGGLPFPIKVCFDEDKYRLPHVNTCALQLTLTFRPELQKPKSGIRLLVECVANSKEFGLA